MELTLGNPRVMKCTATNLIHPHQARQVLVHLLNGGKMGLTALSHQALGVIVRLIGIG